MTSDAVATANLMLKYKRRPPKCSICLQPETAANSSSVGNRFSNVLSDSLEDAFAVDVAGLPRAVWNAQDGKFALYHGTFTMLITDRS